MRPRAGLGCGVLVLTAALLAAGCGGKSGSATRTCVLKARADARAAVIIRAFEQGKLGTRKEVERAVAPRPSFFDPSGRIIPYERQRLSQQLAFDAWANSKRVHEVTGAQEDAALAGLKPDC